MPGPREVIPPLTLRTPRGRILQAWDFKQKKNLVIAFLHADCPPCADFLVRLDARAGELEAHEAVVLAVFPEPPPAAIEDSLSARVIAGADVSGRSAHAYLGEDAFSPRERIGVFVADRYGELYARWVASDEEGLPGMGEILSWLGKIELVSEGCGVSGWPVEG
jgi:hypothetical protein